MVPGPLLGRWLTTQYGLQTILDGKQAFVPTALIFQVAAIATLLTLIPILKTKPNSKLLQKEI